MAGLRTTFQHFRYKSCGMAVKIIQDVENTQIRKRPKEKFMIWSKHEVDPKDFVGQFETWLKALDQLYGKS